jgi:hypothetical protein
VYVTAGIEQPTDLVGHMVAGIVAAALALHKYGRISRVEAVANIEFVKPMYNVTMETEGVLKHYRSLWRSDSFYDDKLWAASWMYRASLTEYADPEKAETFFKHMQDSYYNAIGEEDTYVTDLDYVLNAGVVHAATLSYSYEWQSPAQTLVWDWICSGHPDTTNLGRVYGIPAILPCRLCCLDTECLHAPHCSSTDLDTAHVGWRETLRSWATQSWLPHSHRSTPTRSSTLTRLSLASSAASSASHRIRHASNEPTVLDTPAPAQPVISVTSLGAASAQWMHAPGSVLGMPEAPRPCLTAISWV